MPNAYETARELDSIADLLPTVVKDAFEAPYPLHKKTHKRKPITPHILELIKEKRKLRRQKNLAHGDPVLMRKIQRELNFIGGKSKKSRRGSKDVDMKLLAKGCLLKITPGNSSSRLKH